MAIAKTSKTQAVRPSSLRGPVAGEFPGVKPGALDADLLRALDRREIEVLFQPQFSCQTGALVGAEALARWQHPTLPRTGGRAREAPPREHPRPENPRTPRPRTPY